MKEYDATEIAFKNGYKKAMREVAKEFTCFVGDPHKVERCPYLDEIEKAKTEVARDIFEEIEKLKHTKFDWSDVVDWDGIAELKKKYTEGKDDNKANTEI